jgi:hypothetical protein
VTSSSTLGTNDPKVVFTMLFGSYFGDWDSQDNFLRASLATPSYTLTSAWVGRPWWQFHHMALGETIGFSTRLSQNNSATYPGGNRTRGVHVALMGDPTLRLHPVTPPGDLLVMTNVSSGVDLRWSASSEAVLGYHVYRSASATGPFTRLTSTLLQGTNYSDNVAGSSVYMVRAVKLESCGSGTYYNASQGIFQTLNGSIAALTAPRLKLVAMGYGSFLITGTGLPGKSYTLQASDGLNSAGWYTLGTVTNDAAGSFRVTDISSAAQRAYRTVSP